MKIKGLTHAGIIACLYAVLTLMPGLNALAFGPVQLRVSEVMTVLAVFTPWAVPGLTIGCLIANMIGSPMILDMIFGTAATFFAAVATYKLRKRTIPAIIMPALFNGVIIGSMITAFYSETAFSIKLLLFNMCSVAAGELIVCVVLGYPLIKILRKYKIFN